MGGTVRDLLLDQLPADVDLSAVDGSSEFATALAGELGGVIFARSEFGTSKLKVGDTVIDVANSRKESYAHPGALPTVSPGTIDEDLLDSEHKLQCTSCHDVHTTGLTEYALKYEFDPEQDTDNVICRVCHNK